MCDGGLGVRRDHDGAPTWCRRAAGQGDALAPSGLAVMYADAHGLLPSDVTAYKLRRKR